MIDLSSFRLSVAEQHLGVYGIHILSAQADGPGTEPVEGDSHGRRTLEHRFRSDDPENLYSCSKTFTSVGVGIAIDEGLFSLDNRLLDAFPEYRDSARPGMADVTVRHLLTMTAGVSGVDRDWASDDVAANFLTAEIVHEPGTYFEYQTTETYMLGRMIHRTSGLNLREYLVPRLFDVIGMHNPQWHACAQGYSRAGTDLYARTSELALLGELLLDRGAFRGSRVVSASWVDAMHTDWVDTRSGRNLDQDAESLGYGFQVWRCSVPGLWRADGLYGQFTIVCPDQDAVITVTSHNETSAHAILTALWNDVLPQL